MLTCTHCGTLALLNARCPSCGAPSGRKGATVAAAVLLGLGVGCNGGMDTAVALYGVPAVDADNDGFFEGEDCDDGDPDINPDAPETAGDGIDSNCNDDDDT